jgi:hypothetical protein
MEAWPDELLDLSIPSVEIELSEDDMLALGSTSPSFREFFALGGIRPPSAGLREAIEACLPAFAHGIFPRLGTCSFKRPGIVARPLETAGVVLREITAANERTAAALRNAIREGYPQSLFLREWRDIPAWSEFRVFIRNRRIVGISQYHHRPAFPEIPRNLVSIGFALADGVGQLLSATSMANMTADFFLLGEGSREAVLIEINPFDRSADACLFSWEAGGDFDARLRYREPSGRVASADVRAMLVAHA